MIRSLAALLLLALAPAASAELDPAAFRAPVEADLAQVPSGGTERSRSLLSAAEAGALAARLLPGDLLLERREGDLSHAGLPGFWTHVALYIGTPEERRLFFKGPAVEQWLRGQGQPDGDFERLLHFRSPQNQPASARADEAGHPRRVLEAVSEGVRFGSLEHWAAADSLAVLRPRLPKFEKAAAVLRAFGYAGRPYDFDYDFRTDSALGCTELVFKSYEAGADRKGLRLPLPEVLGRPLLTPNGLALLYDAEAGSEGRQFDLVLFLEGRESEGRAVEAGEEEFRRSWRRPRWRVPVEENP